MIQAVIGRKIDQTQKFLENGVRIPVTAIMVGENVVVQHKTTEKDGYTAVQLGFDTKKKVTKALVGHAKKGAKLEKAPRFLKEVSVVGEDLPTLGDHIKAADVLKPGDLINVTGISKGKGFAGVVKRHHFKGGPRTHGQSDRERAPGSIGQTTTPGRVYKGKRMAGRMGHEQVTVRNLKVMSIVDNTTVLIEGLVPGSKNSIVVIKRVGEMKKFVPLLEDVERAASAKVELVEETPVETVEETVKTEESKEEK